MGKIKIIVTGLMRCGLPFLKYNFFQKNVIRKKGCYLFPYNGTIISLSPSGKLYLSGNLELNAGKYKKSKAESYLVIDDGATAAFDGASRISYGSTIHVNRNAEIRAKTFTTNIGVNFQVARQLIIGEDCMFGRNASIFDSSFHPTGVNKDSLKVNTSAVIIGDHVWVGAGAFIMPGSVIGDGCIIGSQSYVSTNIEAGSTVTRRIDSPQIKGNIWARSTSKRDIEKAILFYSQEADNLVEKDTQYVKEINEVLSINFPQIDFLNEKSLLSQHIVDSLTLVSIVATLEAHFVIRIPYNMISAKEFDGIERMSDLVSRIKKNPNNSKKNNTYSIQKNSDMSSFTDIQRFDSILAAIGYYAEKTPNKLCVSDGIADYTYQSFLNTILQKATALRKIGIKETDKVVAEGYQSPAFVALEFALHCIGAIFVPLEQGCTEEKMVSIAKRCEAKMIVSLKEFKRKENRVLTYAEFNDMSEKCERFVLSFPRTNGISEILFSTGTTGKEKGIVLSHKNSVAVAENIYYGVQMRNDNIELIPSPLNHSHGLRSFYANMIAGSSVVILDNVMDIKKFFDVIDRYGVNSIDLVPTALSVLLKLSGDKFSEYEERLRYIEFGSAPMMDQDREKIISLLPGVPLYNFYGSTEAGRATVYNFNTNNYKEKCIGKPTCNSKLIVVDDNRNEMQSSVELVGLLACSGEMCMVEYYNDAFETSKVMQDGFVYSNDEAYVDLNGDIILLGRRGDVINIGGKKVSPEEIESVAKTMAGIADCGCVAVKDDLAGFVPKLFVQMENGHMFDANAISCFLSERLESFKVPKYIIPIEKIPRTYNGKLLRKELTVM